MTSLIVSHYSLAGAAPPALPTNTFAARVEAAARAGFAGIGLVTWDYRAMRRKGVAPEELQDVLAGHALRVEEVELLTGWLEQPLHRQPSALDERQALVWEMVERFRPHHVIAGDAPPTSRKIEVKEVAKSFRALCDRAADVGVLVGIEFVPGTALPDLGTAAAVVETADRSNGGVLIDIFHFVRGGGKADDLLGLSCPIVGVQLSDHGPRRVDVSHFDEWRYGGLVPGSGDLPIVDVVRAIDHVTPRLPYSVEVLAPGLWALGPIAAAESLARATRAVLAAARS